MTTSAFLKNIPTNVITGFLGVGKTTAILELLKHKPQQESWAVLVNEFGKVGIDGQMLQQDGVAVKEIPGGCMCCAAGVSVQVGMNALLAKARPDRLLIEPTGIGHPKKIIRQLSQPPFDQILDMRACICLVDPRHLKDERYTGNDYYNEQLEIADVLVANKTDQCADTDKAAFEQLLQTRQPTASGWVTQGQLDASWLDLPHTSHASGSILQATIQADLDDEIDAIRLEENESYRRLENRSGDYASSGWLFADNTVFQQQKLITLFNAMDTERIKASLRTDQGNSIFNSVANDMTLTAMDAAPENRIEIIMQHDPDWDKIETALLSCIQ